MGDALHIQFTGSISDRRTAIQRSGQLEGGGAVTFDVPETEMGALAQLMPLARVTLRVTVEVVDAPATAEAAPGEAEKPAWARQRQKRKKRG